MKRIFILLAFLSSGTCCLRAQVFKVDTLIYRGDISKYINFVIMGDGYTNTLQDTFIKNANTLSTYLFTQAPWSNYAGYFNVFAIRVISTDTGAAHPNTAPDCSGYSVPVMSPNTYLGCSFDNSGIHRLITVLKSPALTNVLAKNFPMYDQVFVLSNTGYYGGSGGANFSTGTNHTSSKLILVHELGHAFAQLADEYYAGDVYAAEKANMTMQSNPSLVRWKAWIGTNGTGVYQHCCSTNSLLWYRPHQGCLMQSLSATAYCSVCIEAIIESIHSRVNPVVRYFPATTAVSSSRQFISFALAELMKPQPNTLNITWKLDAKTILKNADSVTIDQAVLTKGTHTLIATVTDTSSLLRVTNHSAVHVNAVTWTIIKNATGVALAPNDHTFNYTVYPNPADKLLNVSLELEQPGYVTIELCSVDGKLILQAPGKMQNRGGQVHTLDIQKLTPGIYHVRLKIGEHTFVQQFVKQ